MNRVKRFFVEKAHQFFTEWVSFEQWLMSKPLDEIIGYSGSACNCPLAIFSKHLGFPVAELTCGHLDILVEGKTITPFGTGKDGNAQDGVLDTEEALWWWDFIELIDKHHKTGTPITAARALAVLACARLFICDATLEDIERVEAKVLAGVPSLKNASDLAPGDQIDMIDIKGEEHRVTVLFLKETTVECSYSSKTIPYTVQHIHCLVVVHLPDNSRQTFTVSPNRPFEIF